MAHKTEYCYRNPTNKSQGTQASCMEGVTSDETVSGEFLHPVVGATVQPNRSVF